jgi:hypothetical protein
MAANPSLDRASKMENKDLNAKTVVSFIAG